MRQCFGRNPLSGILYPDDYPSLSITFSSDIDTSVRWSEFDRVVDNIEQDLLQAVFIGFNGRKVRGDSAVNPLPICQVLRLAVYRRNDGFYLHDLATQDDFPLVQPCQHQ